MEWLNQTGKRNGAPMPINGQSRPMVALLTGSASAGSANPQRLALRLALRLAAPSKNPESAILRFDCMFSIACNQCLC